ncbi:MAG: cytochrome ubiquinol oxidase subunit I [Pseudomonadota bacterium]
MDALMLARIQFAANISFHILFPSISLALAWILLFFKIKFNISKDSKWLDAYKFWVKIFALCFALGVVSGITMSFQFGTNWPGFMQTVGNVAGPLLAYEVLTAFFLEATFLGVMLFGYKRVSNKVHTIATFLVAFGTTASAFWIIALNSWMQTPVGFEMIDGKAYVTNWFEVVFNPSMLYRLTHMLIASGLTAAFLLAGISAYKWLKKDKSVIASLKTGIYLAAILIPLQIFVGDQHGLNTLKYQPAKIAAMEAIWKTQKQAPLLLFAIPDEKQKTNHYELGIPRGASLILTHSLDGEIKGLEEFKDNHPPVMPLFFGFRIMVGIGVLMLIISWLAGAQLLFNNIIKPWVAKLLVTMSFSGWIATLAGWYTTEIGRQPWLVQGILKTAEATAKNVSSEMIISTLIMYLSIYVFLIIAFILVVFNLAKKSIKLESLV